MTWIRTPRLWLRPVTAGDVALLDELNHAPGILTYLAAEVPSPDAVSARLARSLSEARAGLERCLMFTPEGELVGYSGVQVTPLARLDPLEGELAYRLRPEFWRQGIASEAAAAVMERAFLVGGVAAVFAHTMTVNEASQGVMRRMGMHLTGTTFDVEGSLLGAEQGNVRYEVTREEWDTARTDPRAELRSALTAAMKRRDRPVMARLRVASAAVANEESRLPPFLAAPSGPATTASSEHVAGAALGVGAAEAERVWLSDAAVREIIAAADSDE